MGPNIFSPGPKPALGGPDCDIKLIVVVRNTLCMFTSFGLVISYKILLKMLVSTECVNRIKNWSRGLY